jgi:prephenate dehydratase
MLKIGYLGPSGTFSQEAMKVYIKGKERYIEYDYGTIQDTILAVNNGEIDEAIVPTENSLEGAVNVTLDMLAAEDDLQIKAEVIIDIKQNLMAKKGTSLDDIRYILSHPQPIGQCRKYISKNFPDAKIRLLSSTAEAALVVSKGEKNSAAIGSIIISDIYGLDVLKTDIQDGCNNLTRFVVISKNDSGRTGCDKTSIVFSTEDKPGSLYRILDIFNLWDINMTRIESRPAKNQLGSYKFFVDLNGHRDDDNIRDALTMIKKKTSFFKLLGSYPRCGTA